MQGKHISKSQYRRRRITAISLIIIILSLTIVFFVRQQVQAKNQAIMQYTSKHFNKNVEIYDINVGNMTIDQATKKINTKAQNIASLQEDEITTKHSNDVTTISKKQVEQYFNQQHTDFPSKKSWTFENKPLIQATGKLEKIKDQTIAYKLEKQKYDFVAASMFDKIDYYNDQYHFIDDSPLTNKLIEINKKVSTLKKSYQFKTPDNKLITIKNESYGWAINIPKVVQVMKQALIDGKNKINGDQLIYGEGYTTGGTGFTTVNQGLGENYVVVSLAAQKLWIYKNGKNVVTINNVVTGTAHGDKSNQTPPGVWYIMYKQSPSVLRGTNDDGSKYASKVQYWMPFTLSGCGLHDANWRTDWSKTAYLKGGSHGCINIKPSEIKKVWDAVIKDEPVIVY